MNNEIQIIFDGAIGDTIGLSSICEILSKLGKEPVLYTNFPFIFDNNPNIKASYHRNGRIPNIEPCRVYSCNIVNHYLTQLGIDIINSVTPKIYLSKSEISLSEQEFYEFGNNKKIAVCLYSSADSRDLKYENIKDSLLELKRNGHKLIFFGTKMPNDYENIFDKYVVGGYGIDMRKVFYLLAQCDVYFGVDTGLFHAAAAVDIPQVVFFRNNGCKNNAYKNTYYIDSNISCGNTCHAPGVVNCFQETRCMDNFDFKSYTQLLNNII